MSRVLASAGPIPGGVRLKLRLLAVGRELGSTLAFVRSVSPAGALAAAGVLQLRLRGHVTQRASFATHLDEVAGGEFVDDQIRRLE